MPTSLEFLKEMWESPNVKAAAKAVRFAEGTTAADGHNYLFSSSPKNDLRFSAYATHPNILIKSKNGYASTAAGAYQILKVTFDFLCSKYRFTDFLPETQDLMFCALLDNRNCLKLVRDGLFLTDHVQTEMGKEWASLPLSNYGQPERTIADIKKFYLISGGSIA